MITDLTSPTLRQEILNLIGALIRILRLSEQQRLTLRERIRRRRVQQQVKKVRLILLRRM